MRPNIRRLKAEHDVVFRHAGFFEFGGDAVLDPILLHPDFAVNDFQVNDDCMYAARLVPSFTQKQIAVGLAIKNSLGPEFRVILQVAQMVGQRLFDYGSVAIQFIHITTSSVVGSNINSHTPSAFKNSATYA